MDWIKNPPFGIKDENALQQQYETHCAKNLSHVGFQAKISKQRVLDVSKAWKEDLTRARQGSFRDPNITPDHIKCAAHLTYWLRREAPVIDLMSTTGMYSEIEQVCLETGAGDLGELTEVPDEELPNLKLSNGLSASDYVENRKLVIAYSNEFLAFTFGFTLAKAYEEQKVLEKTGNAKKIPMPSKEYVEDLCYFFKFKSVSPHSIDLIYRALLRNG